MGGTRGLRAPIGVEAEVVVRLLALEGRLAAHLSLDVTKRQPVAAGLGAKASLEAMKRPPGEVGGGTEEVPTVWARNGAAEGGPIRRRVLRCPVTHQWVP